MMIKVGIYWANIKGRFASKGRLYLAMKYGLKWKYRTLLNK
jgi:hypothetical protein